MNRGGGTFYGGVPPETVAFAHRNPVANETQPTGNPGVTFPPETGGFVTDSQTPPLRAKTTGKKGSFRGGRIGERQASDTRFCGFLLPHSFRWNGGSGGRRKFCSRAKSWTDIDAKTMTDREGRRWGKGTATERKEVTTERK